MSVRQVAYTLSFG